MHKLLIANRGEIACRIAKAARSQGVRTVAIFTDVDAHAPHVQLCDEAVHIGVEGRGKSPYLNIKAILQAAEQTQADSVHPGYGFLAERADFAREVQDAGLTWVGPPPLVMERLGRKDAAKVLARSISVPVVPGFELGADPQKHVQEKVDGAELDLLQAWLGEREQDGQKVPVLSEKLQKAIAEVGFPLLIKAVAGGGGRGMRVVRALEELPGSLRLAAREAQEAFGDGTLLVERYVERGRHVEVQILADAHGSVLHLGERECSIQRRHQKLLEESPSPGLTPELREKMTHAAVRLAQAVGYVSAGTVEFLLDDERGEFYFLEVNTRIQVEHPVTELVTGIDLVGWQLWIARGVPLSIRQVEVLQTGHAIEARLCAEDPQQNFAPQVGEILRWVPPEGEDVRVDHGLNRQDSVSVHYDAMIAKILAWGPDRQTAIARLRKALADTQLLGLTTNLAHLQQVLAEPDFVAGRMTTRYLESHPVAPPVPIPDLGLLALALWQTGEALLKRFRNNVNRPDITVLAVDGQLVHVALQKQSGRTLAWGVERKPDPLLWQIAALIEHVELQEVSAESVTFTAFQQRQTWRIAQKDRELWLHSPHGQTWKVLEDSLLPQPKQAQIAAGSVTAPMAAVVSQVHVQVDQAVEADQPLLTLESMKMLTILKAPTAGVVRAILAQIGESVAAGMVLVEVTAAESIQL